jgi:hypothetical protein
MLFGLVFYLDLFRSVVVEGSNPLKGNAFWTQVNLIGTSVKFIDLGSSPSRVNFKCLLQIWAAFLHLDSAHLTLFLDQIEGGLLHFSAQIAAILKSQGVASS